MKFSIFAFTFEQNAELLIFQLRHVTSFPPASSSIEPYSSNSNRISNTQMILKKYLESRKNQRNPPIASISAFLFVACFIRIDPFQSICLRKDERCLRNRDELSYDMIVRFAFPSGVKVNKREIYGINKYNRNRKY